MSERTSCRADCIIRQDNYLLPNLPPRNETKENGLIRAWVMLTDAVLIKYRMEIRAVVTREIVFTR